jgi:hypothetical protein
MNPEAELSRSRRTMRDALDPQPLSLLLDAQVLTVAEWCKLNRISGRTGRRILAAPGGPTVVWLTTRKKGITVGANKRWQQSRERK